MKRCCARALVAGVLVSWPGAASAHLVTTGLGPVYDGVSHLFLTFEDLLPVVAMAALAALNGPAAARRALFVLPITWFTAGLAGHAMGVAILPAGVTAASLLALGILTAVDRKLSTTVVSMIALLLGAVHGWLNGASIAAAGREARGLVGIAVAIFLLTALGSALVVSLRRPWTRVAVRAAGSWIAAVGLLFLGWILSGRA